MSHGLLVQLYLCRSAPHFDPWIQHSLITVTVAYIIVDQGPKTMFRQTAVTNAYFWFRLGRGPLLLFLRSPEPTSSTETYYWHGFVLFRSFSTFFFHKCVKIGDICLGTDLCDGSVLSRALTCFRVCAAVIVRKTMTLGLALTSGFDGAGETTQLARTNSSAQQGGDRVGKSSWNVVDGRARGTRERRSHFHISRITFWERRSIPGPLYLISCNVINARMYSDKWQK